MQSVKKVASIALSVVMLIIILVAALYAFTTLATHEDGSVSDIAGFTPLAVQSDSMAPTFNKGDLIIIQKCDTSKLEVGDIVTFHHHRQRVRAQHAPHRRDRRGQRHAQLYHQGR